MCRATAPIIPVATYDSFRDRAVAKGIIVNGIVILTDIQFAQNPAHTNPPGGIEKYHRDNVIGGPGSFVIVAEDYNSFGRAMVKKLIAEIATGSAQRRSASVDRSNAIQERRESEGLHDPRGGGAMNFGYPRRVELEPQSQEIP